MKRISLLILVILVIAVPASADKYFKVKSHTDENYHHGALTPAVDNESEIWVGNGKMAYIDDDRHFIFDIEGGRLIVMEMADTAYVETDLPLDLTKIVPPDFVQRLAMYPTTGEVKHLEETKEIHGKKCRSYMVHHWIDYNESKYNETERVVWATDDMKIGKEFEDAWMQAMFTMYNFTPELIAGIMEAGGWELLATSIRYSEGQSINSSREIIAIEDKAPESDVYSVPSHFRKKDYIDTRR